MSTIPLPALHINPPAAQPNVLDQYSQLQQLQQAQAMRPLQLQAARQQVQAGQLQNQGTQQDLAARQALNDAYHGALSTDANGNQSFDPDKLMKSLQSGPAAYKTPEVIEGITKFQKGQLDLKTAAADLQTKTQDMLGGAASAIKAAGYDPTLAHSLLDSLPPSPQVNQIRQQIDNPQSLRQLVDSAIQGSAKQRELGAQETTANARQTTAQTEQQKLQASMNPQSSLYAPSAQSVALGTAPGAAQIKNNEVQQAARKAGAEESARMPGEMALAQQKQALSQGDPNAAGQLLANHDATLSELKSRGATPEFIARALFAAKRINPSYNPQEDEAQFDVAKSPQNVGFFGSAKSLTDKGGTLDQLAEAAKAIPHSKIPVFNSMADVVKAAGGSGPLAKYAALVVGISDDDAKVMGGGIGSDASRLQVANLVPANASPEARAGALEGIRGSVNSQVVSRIGKNPILQRMYGNGTGSPTAGAPAPKGPPTGATHIVPGSDGKMHYTDGKSDLGVVQ